MPDRWLTPAQAAAYLGLNPKYVLTLVSQQRLRAARLGHTTVRFRREDLDEFMHHPVAAHDSDPPDEWWDAHRVAAHIGISSEQVRRHYRQGRLRGTPIGQRRIRFHPRDVEAFMEAHIV